MTNNTLHDCPRTTKETVISNWINEDNWIEGYFHPNETVWQDNTSYSYTWITGEERFSAWYMHHSLGAYNTIEEAKVACYEHAAQDYINAF